MSKLAKMVHLDGADYIDLPHYGGCARDRRRARMPRCQVPSSPTHTVSFIFSDVTFRTNVTAGSRSEAETRAVQNLRYTFWPEQRLKALGPILKVIIHDA